MPKGEGMHEQTRRVLARAGRALVAVGVVAGIGIGVPAAADAKPGDGAGASTSTVSKSWPGRAPVGFSSWAELFQVQNRLIAAAERINAAPEAQVGLGGIVARPESRRLKVYWKGSQPAAVRQLIADLRRQVPIDVLPARFSSAELVAASRQAADRPGVATSAPNADGSGVTVTMTAQTAARSLAPDAIGDIPVSVEAGSEPVPVACTGRQDDCSPYFGGAMYNNACTTGFSIQHNGRTEMITAAHCANNGVAVNDGGGERIGVTAERQAGRDTILIQHTAGASSNGHVYVGPWNAATGSNRRVTGSSPSVVGLVVCTSGSFTGEHCELRIRAVNLTINAGSAGTFFPEVQASPDNGGVAAGDGDSGGPVYFGNADGTVRATGTNSAVDTILACPPGTRSSICGGRLYYADLPQALAFYGATITTS
jgi:hypothetical protein